MSELTPKEGVLRPPRRFSTSAPAMFTLIYLAGCARPVWPEYVPTGLAQAQPASASQIPSDSACRTVTFTFSGSNGIAVAFPNRAACTAGLIVIPGGPATRSGGGGKNANVPVRLLNRSGYPVHSPATLVLAPGGRVVLDPLGQPATKITPQNADSVRSGSWVWLAGVPGTVQIDDSTSAKTLVVALASPASSAQVTFTVEAERLVGGIWPLVTENIPDPDTTNLIGRPGTGTVYYRVDATLMFKAGVSDAAKQSFFAELGVTPRGVTSDGLFCEDSGSRKFDCGIRCLLRNAERTIRGFWRNSGSEIGRWQSDRWAVSRRWRWPDPQRLAKSQSDHVGNASHSCPTRLGM